MSDEKKRFSARVDVDTLDTLDAEADRRGLNRSQTIERVVAEWEESQIEDESVGGGRTFIETLASFRAVAVGVGLVLVATVLMLGAAFAAEAGMLLVGAAALVLSTGALMLAALIIWLAAIAQWALSRPLKALAFPGEVRHD